MRRPWAHPRSRGENPLSLTPEAAEKGSSPLTRGKFLAPLGHQDDLGLIPAHAGKISGAIRHRDAIGAHPRSRGENPPR